MSTKYPNTPPKSSRRLLGVIEQAKEDQEATDRAIKQLQTMELELGKKTTSLRETQLEANSIEDKIEKGVYKGDELKKTKSLIEMNKRIQKDVRAMLMKVRSELTHLGDTKGGRRRKSRHRRQNNNKTKRKYK
jgi:hypothetical protein